MSRQSKREMEIIFSIQDKLDKKHDELLELGLYERREVWDGTETPQIHFEEEKRARLESEYSEIHNELQMALEDYGWNK